MNLGKLGVWYFTDLMSANKAAEAAQRIEALGYSALWIPEAVGRNPFAHAAWLLAKTQKLIVATGIASIYHREPGVTMAGQKTLAEQSNNRFLLGLGVSHKPMVEGVRGLEYGKPVETMRNYLAKMDASPYSAVQPSEAPPRVIAALGPKMLELARDTCAGAHPYFSSPDHTAMARKVLGPKPWLCVEQKVILETDATKARALGRAGAAMYLTLPNYRNNWLRSGMRKQTSPTAVRTNSSTRRLRGARSTRSRRASKRTSTPARATSAFSRSIQTARSATCTGRRSKS